MQPQSLFAAGSGTDFVSFLLQVELQRTREVQLVFDQENSISFLFCSVLVFQSLLSGCGLKLRRAAGFQYLRTRGNRTLNVAPRPTPWLDAQTLPR